MKQTMKIWAVTLVGMASVLCPLRYGDKIKV